MTSTPALRKRSLRRRARSLFLIGAAAVLAGIAAVPASAHSAAPADDPHSLIQGSGSSWAANAVNQWVADVAVNGLKVVFTSTGSAQGRKDFANAITDFGVTDIGFQGQDAVAGTNDTSNGRNFAYLPIVSGGTSFPYQVRVAGKLRDNIRLSGTTITKIFTNQITNWNDPAITADNNGSALPSLPIIPIVHTEGSGSTAQFTKWMDTQYKSLWEGYSQGVGETEYFPRAGNQISQNGSDAVINYLTSSAANGAIAYDEYSYPLAKSYPVIKVENAGGYFTLPTQYNVAVALVKASINQDPASPNYLLQDLTNVYTDSDIRTYPLSSYSYAIIPLGSTDSTMTTPKRQTIVDYLYYSVCDGQKEIGPIGYSALPVNLVQASFAQISKLKDADSNVDITNRDVSSCNNPTFVPGDPSGNYLANTAPQPPACDQSGMGPCLDAGDSGTTAVVNPNAGGKSAATVAASKAATSPVAKGQAAKTTTTTTTTKSGTTPVGTTAGTGVSTTAGASTGTGAATGTAAAGTGTGAATGTTVAAINPAKGAVDTSAATGASPEAGSAAGTDSSGGNPAPTSLASATVGSSPRVFGGLAAVILLLVLAAPPVLASRLRRTKP